MATHTFIGIFLRNDAGTDIPVALNNLQQSSAVKMPTCQGLIADIKAYWLSVKCFHTHHGNRQA
jgi:hypothetical protein